MQRSKLLAVAVAFVASGVAAFLLVGGASASSWHDYKGDLYAGHAYGIDVPPGAQSLEFALAGDDAASVASLGVFAPSGKRLGVYDLTTIVRSASVANPDAGRYVAYVYDLDGALDVRVDAESAPAAIDLQTIPLVREDVEIGTFEQAKLDKIVTSDLRAAPVFVTLLYEGSARALDATVSSEKGDVAIIRGETGTAFAPGVWTSLKGERSFQAANLEGTVYTVNAHAESFEGTMVLSTLAIDLSTPVEPPTVPTPPSNVTPMPGHPHPGWDGTAGGAFPLAEGSAIAFSALPGTLHLADPALLESTQRRDDCSFVHGLVTIYDPSDAVVAVVELNHDAPMATVELTSAGEYVAYVTRAQKEVLLAHLPGQAFPTLRNLALADEAFAVDASSLFVAADEPPQIELARVPVALALDMGQGISAVGRVEIVNEIGTVAYADDLLGFGGASFTQWSAVFPENFRSGTHDVLVDGVYEGTISIVILHYLRDVEATPAEADDDAAKEEEEGEPAGPAPAWPFGPEPEEPAEPSTPASAPAVDFAALFAMLPI